MHFKSQRVQNVQTGFFGFCEFLGLYFYHYYDICMAQFQTNIGSNVNKLLNRLDV